MVMKNRSFKFKIIIPTVIILIALVLLINIFLSLKLSNIGNSLIDEKLLSVTNSLNHYLDESRGKSNVAALAMAQNPGVVNAVKKRDTNELVRLLAPS